MSAFLEAALGYASRGWRVFPCLPREKRPAVAGGFKAASSLPSQVRDWWRRWPDANVAVATGQASGFAALDLDPRNDPDGVGRAAVEALDLPGTLIQRTGGGGEQRLFGLRSTSRGRNGVAPGVDWKADGGYIMVPPSRHPSGATYRWLDPTVSVADAPTALLEFVQPTIRETVAPVRMEGVALGGRNPAYVARVRRYVMCCPESVDGQMGSFAVMAVCAQLAAEERDGLLGEADVWSILDQFNQERAVPPWPESELARKLNDARTGQRKNSLLARDLLARRTAQ